MDFVDDANKTLGYTVVEGNPAYDYVNVGLKFALGATAGTTDATWATTYRSNGRHGTVGAREERLYQGAQNLRQCYQGQLIGSPKSCACAWNRMLRLIVIYHSSH